MSLCTWYHWPIRKTLFNFQINEHSIWRGCGWFDRRGAQFLIQSNRGQLEINRVQIRGKSNRMELNMVDY